VEVATSLTSTELIELCDRMLSYRQLDTWVRAGLIRPTDSTLPAYRRSNRTNGAPGNGYNRLWSQEEAKVVHLMARLVAAGLSNRAAARIARGDRVLASGITLVIN
jgi:hypothetical protein